MMDVFLVKQNAVGRSVVNMIFPKSHFWKKYDQDQLDELTERIFDHYRKKGFPYHEYTFGERKKEYQKIKEYVRQNSLIDSKMRIQQTMHGLGLAWYYFPHHWEIQCSNLRTPMEVFNDDELFRKAIRKRLSMGTYLSDSGMRKMLKIFTGTQCVSNFRPTAAYAIYDYFQPKDVWDMSGGFGGRMIGASLCPSIQEYHYTEPSEKTFQGLKNLSEDLKLFGCKINCYGYKEGSEDFDLFENKFDLCFTSPPYFDTEKYSNESSQSYIKYPSKEKWLYDFLGKTMDNCYRGLKEYGRMVINIANTKSFPNIERELVAIAILKGFRLYNAFALMLSKIGDKRIEKYKYEPVFIFIKG